MTRISDEEIARMRDEVGAVTRLYDVPSWPQSTTRVIATRYRDDVGALLAERVALLAERAHAVAIAAAEARAVALQEAASNKDDMAERAYLDGRAAARADALEEAARVCDERCTHLRGAFERMICDGTGDNAEHMGAVRAAAEAGDCADAIRALAKGGDGG